MQQGWIKINDEGYSQIVIEADGKKIPLRYTVSQHERMLAFNAKQLERQEKEKNGEFKVDFLKQRAEDDLEVCFIALNPNGMNLDYSKEDINEMLDIDQQRILAGIWISKKVLQPSMEAKEEGKSQGK